MEPINFEQEKLQLIRLIAEQDATSIQTMIVSLGERLQNNEAALDFVIEQVLPLVSAEERQWFYPNVLGQDVSSRLMQDGMMILVQNLLTQGCELNIDIRTEMENGEQKLLLSQKAIDILSGELPLEFLNELVSPPESEPEPESPPTAAEPEEYDPQACVTAGELRSAGIEVPDNIPNCAWIHRSAIRMTGMELGESNLEEGIINLEWTTEFLAPFQWLSVPVTLDQNVVVG